MKDTLFSQQMEYLKAATCSPAAFEAYQFNERLENSLEERIREKRGSQRGKYKEAHNLEISYLV